MAFKKQYDSRVGVLIIGFFLLLLNWAASVWHTRVDFTSEKRFTLSEATKKLLKKTEGVVQVQVFLKGNLPSGFKQLGKSTEEMLQEFKEVAGNKIEYHFISPDEKIPGTGTSYADTLGAMGLYPINLTSQVEQGQQQQLVYPAALIEYNNLLMPVSLYQGKTPLINFQELSSAAALLEYKLADGISKITINEKPVVAFAIGNGEPEDYSTYDLVQNVLKPNYTLFTFNLKTQPLLPREFKVLLVVKPTIPFGDDEKLKLDQYVMNGGKIIWFVDRLNAEMDSLQIKNEVIAYDRNLNLSDLFFRYGVRQNPDLVMDLQCDQLPFDVNGNGQFELLPWNYFPVFDSKNNHPINRNLGFVVGRFVNSIDTVEAPGIKKTVLLSSSANARKIGTPALISGKENVNAPEDDNFKTANIPVAVLLEGKFRSLYANRLSQSMQDSLVKYNAQYLPENIHDTKMIMVADGDIPLNAVIKGGQPIAMGLNPYTYGTQREFMFANREFVINCLEFLVNENGLSEARAKDFVVRLLDIKKVKEEKIFWQAINTALPILLVIIFALFFTWMRKRKYAKTRA
ncbi:MAG: gliding motility-associated ABC transporter substrate-binding protein GldG [Niastella sp.]|nr:gliding motility-associated ABC transporter substrate-binding protein GldG [Niastella sp.]